MPRPILRVGTTGHRTNVLSAGDIERRRTPVGAVRDGLDRIARSVLRQYTRVFGPVPQKEG